jgi:enolase
MSPKEKAQELFSKYNRKGLYQISNVINRIVRKEIIKECVLIAIDEIIQSIKHTEAKSDLGYIGYWNKVKEEIKNI